MKVGILTFYRAANFGGLLQAEALRRFLEARGHDVVFVEDPALYPPRPALAACCLARSFRGLKLKLGRWLLFRRATFASGAPTCGYDRADLQAVVVGSDQVWNPAWYGAPAFVEKLFLGWCAPETRRIAYAASFGASEWSAPETRGRVGELLRSFVGVSVREETGRALAAALSGRTDVRVLADPVLLQAPAFYRRYYSPRQRGRAEVFHYRLDWSPAGSTEGALRLACAHYDVPAHEVRAGDRVGDWLADLASAACVVTNSFHGVAFALLFHRPFVALRLTGDGTGMNARLETLLASVGLEDRFVAADDADAVQRALASEPAWPRVDAVLRRMRDEAVAFFEEVGL